MDCVLVFKTAALIEESNALTAFLAILRLTAVNSTV